MKRACINPAILPRTSSEYFANMASKGEPLEPLGKPCHDCAVEDGYYAGMSDDLAKEPLEVQDAVAARWFCHNNPNRACRGNIDRLACANHREKQPDAQPKETPSVQTT